MNIRQALLRTLIALAILLAAFLYAMLVVPGDYIIDIREAIVTVGAILIATLILAWAWLSFIIRQTRRLIRLIATKTKNRGRSGNNRKPARKHQSSPSKSH